MTNTFWNVAIICATLLGPLAAVQATLWIERLRKAREERDKVFKTLMMTRAHPIEYRQMEALNTIDVTFTRRRKDRPVRDAWHRYLAHLGNKAYPQDAWNTRRYELFVELLHVMSRACGFDFDRAQIETTPYFPVGFGTQQDQEAAIRAGFVKLLAGELPLRVAVVDHVTIPQQQPLSLPPQQPVTVPQALPMTAPQAGSAPPSGPDVVVPIREGQAIGGGGKNV